MHKIIKDKKPTARHYPPRCRVAVRARARKIGSAANADPVSVLPIREEDMKENYLISIKGRQQVDGETGEIELTTLGSYMKRGTSRYIVYQDYASEEDSAPRTSILKVEGASRLTLMRKGGDNTRLILENGKRHLCQYDTGFGNLTVGVFTNRLESSLNDDGGHLDISYTLDIDSELSSLNELSITIKEAKNSDV
jgi:uncharacterized beta-barrel protein YwiB (DUF1934 family)